MLFALEITRLSQELDVAARCIVSTDDTNGVTRFHRLRQGERWGARDLNSYTAAMFVEIDSGPEDCAGRPDAQR